MGVNQFTSVSPDVPYFPKKTIDFLIILREIEVNSLKFAGYCKRNLASTSLQIVHQFVDFFVNFQQIIASYFLWIMFFCTTSTTIIC